MKRSTDKLLVSDTANISAPSPVVNVTKLLQKYRVRQHEMERQIEELQNSNRELETSRDKYALLYDFAPVGYFTFDREGAIRTVNLTGANLLRMERSSLSNLRFEHFVSEEDRFVFADFLRMIFLGHDKITCRVKLSINSKQPLYVRIEAMADESGDECLAALMDITERNRAEEHLRESEYNLAKAQSMSHVGSWRSDPLTGELRASDELLRIM
ncbi:MAG: PAS domain-containing protein, partial [Deltaproteobacteria bacterium]